MDPSSFDYKSFLAIVGAVATAVAAPLLAAVKWLFNAREREHAQILKSSEAQVNECKLERDRLYAKLDEENKRHHEQMLDAHRQHHEQMTKSGEQHHEQMLATTKQNAQEIGKMLDDNKRLINQHVTTSAQISEWMTQQNHAVEVLAEEITDLKRGLANAMDREKDTRR